jgi:transmembrane sensor
MDDADETATIAEQASHWWVALHGENSDPHLRRTFAAWAACSPQHVAAYLRVARAIRAVRHADVRWPDTSADDLIRDAREARTSVVQMHQRSERGLRARSADTVTSRPSHSRRFPAIAASVVLAIVGALAGWWLVSPDHYTTRVGEQRSVTLDDGSIVTLNTSSEIEVRFTAAHRTVRLLEGEALFQVAHDAARPFDVVTGNTLVRAVGTEFNVDQRKTRTTVTVVEGRVAITPQIPTSGSAATGSMLAATEQVVIDNGKIGAPARVASVSPVLAWTRRQLVFDRRPIGEVAAEFNRYNRRQIEIRATALADEPLTGVFQANDTQSFLTFLTHMQDVRVDDSGSDVVRVTMR